MNVKLLSDAKCIVGEGPIWDKKNNRLLMVDIQGKRLRKISFTDNSICDIVLPYQVGFIFFDINYDIFGGSEDGIYKISESGIMTKISKTCKLKGERFNDGKVAPNGLLYGGTFSRDYSAAFYRLNKDGSLTELFDKVGNSNGLAWNKENTIMYYNDTPLKRTDMFTFTNGQLKDRKTLIEYSEGYPDGMTIDSKNNLYVALWGAGKVVKVDTKLGKIIDEIILPVSQPSCCTFCGKDLKSLAITSAAHGKMLRDEPLAGSTFIVDMNIKGLDVNLFEYNGDIK